MGQTGQNQPDGVVVAQWLKRWETYRKVVSSNPSSQSTTVGPLSKAFNAQLLTCTASLSG